MVDQMNQWIFFQSGVVSLFDVPSWLFFTLFSSSLVVIMEPLLIMAIIITLAQILEATQFTAVNMQQIYKWD